MGGVPILLAFSGREERPLPVVLWFHGFGVDKQVHRPELERLAKAGFLAVGVDAAGHGERRLVDLSDRMAAPREEVRRTMMTLASETAGEVPVIVQALSREGIGDAGRVALAGVSMGGYVVYRALVVEPTIRAAVAILGSPEWPDHPDSPHHHLHAIRQTALLSITAENDENVPPAAARRLHDQLSAAQPDAGRQRYVELPGAQHLMAAGEWDTVMEETLRWLRRHNL